MNEDEVWQRVHSLYASDATASALGVKLDAAAEGSAVVRLQVAEQHLGSLGQMHGGVLFTLADVAMSYACNSRGGTSMAVGASIDFIDSTALGEVLVAEATEHNLRGKAGIYDVTIRTKADDRLVATFRGNTLRVG